MMRYVLALALVGLVAFGLWRGSSAQVVVAAGSPGAEAEVKSLVGEGDKQAQTEREDSAQQRHALQAQDLAQEFKALLAQAKTEPGNAQAWLERLWRKCQSLGEEGCAMLQAQMRPYLAKDEAAWLAAALKNYSAYYQELSASTQSTIEPASKRYEHIKELRETHFGAQAHALFGREDTYAQLQWAYQDLQKNAASLAVEERFAALDKLQADAQLGEDAPSLLSADARYQQALGLLNEVEQAKWRTALQQRYFGKEAEAVAHYEQQQSAQQELQSRYEEAVQQLNRRYEVQGKNSQAYQQELGLLRQKLFSSAQN